MSKNKNKGRTNANTNQKAKVLPFQTIKAATGGNVDAINKVLKHFEGYIIALSTERLYDEGGNVRFVVNNDIRRTLETKLITKVLQFDVNRIA